MAPQTSAIVAPGFAAAMPSSIARTTNWYLSSSSAEPGMPCAPLDVSSDTSTTTIRSCVDNGVLVACAMKITASVR